MDHIADANLTTFHEINQQHELPEFVKKASINRDTVRELPSGSFADPITRAFPCHTRADTFLSYAYFLKNANQVPAWRRADVWNNLRKFASQWSIHLQCEQLQREHEKQAQTNFDALPDHEFAIVEMYGGSKHRSLPLVNDDCVKAAAEHLYTYRNRYPLEWRKRAAARILKTASDRGVEIQFTDYLQKASSDYSAPNTSIAQGMLDRAVLINRKHRGSDEQIALTKAARAIAANSRSIDASKAAQLLDNFDQTYNLKHLYRHGLDTPEEICFQAPQIKSAQVVRDNLIELTNGSVYSKAALEQAGITPYRALGDELVTELSDGLSGVDMDKVAAIVPTLPRTDADLLDRALSAVGVKSAAAICDEVGAPKNMTQWTEDHWRAIVAKLTASN